MCMEIVLNVIFLEKKVELLVVDCVYSKRNCLLCYIMKQLQFFAELDIQ